MNKKNLALSGVLLALLILIIGFSTAFAVQAISKKRLYEAKKAKFLTSGITVQFIDRTASIRPINVSTFADQTQELLQIPAQEKKSATILREKGRYKIEPEIIGYRLDRNALMDELNGRIRTFSHTPIIVKLTNETPEILNSDFQVALPEIQKKFDTPIIASFGDFTFTLRLRDNMNLLEFHKNTALETTLSKEAFTQFIQKNWAPKIDQPATPVAISLKNDKRLQFDGKGKNGRTLNIEELRHIMNTALENNISKVELPIDEQPFTLSMTPEVEAMGIKEVIGIGHTTYYGSPVNRMFNIAIGMKKFDGIIIPPGGIFSFNDNLGPVDDKHGFRKELVIKPEGTIPEFGGGLCQVSTTAYRAALYSGLPIVERSPHSYAVSYYSQVGGHGIDATIYPGARDMKFKNDTMGHIGMQSYAEGAEAYFILYGTRDGRTVKLDGPIITNRHSEGGTETTKTATLPVGKTQQIEKAHQGFDALWHRYVTLPGGLTSKEVIASKYRATKNRFLVGAAPEEIDAEKTTPAATPSFTD